MNNENEIKRIKNILIGLSLIAVGFCAATTTTNLTTILIPIPISVGMGLLASSLPDDVSSRDAAGVFTSFALLLECYIVLGSFGVSMSIGIMLGFVGVDLIPFIALGAIPPVLFLVYGMDYLSDIILIQEESREGKEEKERNQGGD